MSMTPQLESSIISRPVSSHVWWLMPAAHVGTVSQETDMCLFVEPHNMVTEFQAETPL